MKQNLIEKTCGARPKVMAVVAVSMFAALTWCSTGTAADHDDDAKGPAGVATVADAKKDEHKDEVKLTPESARRYGVRTGVVKKHTLATRFVAPARVSLNSEAMAVVGSAVQGRVVDLKVRVGDLVKKGDELLVLESPELGEAQSDYLQKRAALAGARAVIEPAKGAAERAKSLYQGTQGISLTDLQKREVEYATAQNNLLVAQAAADASLSKLSLLGLDADRIEQLVKTSQINARYIVHAAISGHVIERPVNLGELVKPEREKLLLLADTTVLWVLADVPEARLKEIAKGAKATVTLGAVGEQTYEGTISNIALSVDPATRSIPVRIEIKADALIKPGMFAQVEITSKLGGEKPDAAVLAVPDAAIQTVDGSNAVFTPVKGEANTYVVRKVSVGPSIGGMVSIISGLEDGERIVMAGTFILKADLGKASAKED